MFLFEIVEDAELSVLTFYNYLEIMKVYLLSYHTCKIHIYPYLGKVGL